MNNITKIKKHYFKQVIEDCLKYEEAKKKIPVVKKILLCPIKIIKDEIFIKKDLNSCYLIKNNNAFVLKNFADNCYGKRSGQILFFVLFALSKKCFDYQLYFNILYSYNFSKSKFIIKDIPVESIKKLEKMNLNFDEILEILDIYKFSNRIKNISMFYLPSKDKIVCNDYEMKQIIRRAFETEDQFKNKEEIVITHCEDIHGATLISFGHYKHKKILISKNRSLYKLIENYNISIINNIIFKEFYNKNVILNINTLEEIPVNQIGRVANIASGLNFLKLDRVFFKSDFQLTSSKIKVIKLLEHKYYILTFAKKVEINNAKMSDISCLIVKNKCFLIYNNSILNELFNQQTFKKQCEYIDKNMSEIKKQHKLITFKTIWNEVNLKLPLKKLIIV